MNNKDTFISRVLTFIKPGKYNGNNLRYYEHLLDGDSLFYIEDYFHDLLYMERKRAERSLKPFLLMLLDVGNLFRDKGENKYIKKIANMLSSCKRETDVAGWYKYDSIIGVIFTEIGEIKEEFIRRKICDNLGNVLNTGQIKKIKITFHVFPEKGGKSKPVERKPDLILSPEKTKLRYCKKTSVYIKRFFDVVASVTGIILLSPFFLMIPLLIKFSSEGPVLFRQKRVGQYAKDFTFLKFRTMRVNNDDSIHKKYVADLIRNNNGGRGAQENGDKKKTYKIKNDPRVTPVGNFLRKSSMDEIPQLFNVLKGDMSLVGPRPPIPYEIENYNVWHKRRIRRVKPGITGIWQTNGRSSTTFDEMVRMDIKYMREWTLLLDIKILLKTPFVVLKGKGAY